MKPVLATSETLERETATLTAPPPPSCNSLATRTPHPRAPGISSDRLAEVNSTYQPWSSEQTLCANSPANSPTYSPTYSPSSPTYSPSESWWPSDM